MAESDIFFPLLEKKLKKIFNKAERNTVFPGAAVGIALGREMEEKYSFVYGRRSLFPEPDDLTPDCYFDLASLTKPLATTLAVLCLLKEGKISLDDKLADLLEQEVGLDKQEITIVHLLNHCSGLAAHRYYNQDLIKFPEEKRLPALVSLICAEPLEYETGQASVYSDLGFMLLGRIVEIKSAKRLDEYLREKIYAPLGLDNDIFFNRIKGPKKGVYASTAYCPWRRKIIRGTVHDDNCHALGGVAGHAGLFANIKGVLALVCFLAACWHDKAGLPGFNNEDLREFFKRRGVVKNSTWALGFDTPSSVGSSAGRFISSNSVGHLGFSGTSFWIDPVRHLVMVLLTNRIHPDPANERIKKFRPFFHDTVIAALDKERG